MVPRDVPTKCVPQSGLKVPDLCISLASLMSQVENNARYIREDSCRIVGALIISRSVPGCAGARLKAGSKLACFLSHFNQRQALLEYHRQPSVHI